LVHLKDSKKAAKMAAATAVMRELLMVSSMEQQLGNYLVVLLGLLMERYSVDWTVVTMGKSTDLMLVAQSVSTTVN
jgi:hypothetical protein